MAGVTADPFRAARLLLHLRQEGVTDARVLTAMEALDRAAFVHDPSLAPLAFADAVIPIPCGQSMLRPAAVGHLLQALALPEDGSARVLLVGFGSGYMTVALARLSRQVHALERYERLVREGRQRLARMDIGNVTVEQADGFDGAPGAAPFDRIVLAGSVPEVPGALVRQLAPSGLLAAPLALGNGCEIVTATAEGSHAATAFFQHVPALTRGVARVL